jgi:hypothetical protein
MWLCYLLRELLRGAAGEADTSDVASALRFRVVGATGCGLLSLLVALVDMATGGVAVATAAVEPGVEAEAAGDFDCDGVAAAVRVCR